MPGELHSWRVAFLEIGIPGDWKSWRFEFVERFAFVKTGIPGDWHSLIPRLLGSLAP
jgi:hypothetical protein